MESMSASEFVHWMAFHDIDPITQDRDDLRSAQICSTVANVMTKDGGFKASDFMPEFKPQEQQDEPDDDQLLLQGMKMVAAFGGTIGKGE